MKATRACSVEDCQRPVKARDLCATHYRRWRETGNPGGAEIEARRPGRTCAAEDCSAPVRCGEWCRKHYDRWKKHNDPEFPWRLDLVGYAAAHVRLRKLRGVARAQACESCGGRASDWAYDNQDPDVLYGDNHGVMCAYSLDPNHYIPLCKSCHKNFDNSARREVLDEP